ncbi:ArsR/SmtB family transcription factor [Cohnella sp.]|uniref:ArsR/SmtB family transcription factor n=1 Tax=Cohnella sp. TaxID=1883426 RepID=UPI003566B847
MKRNVSSIASLISDPSRAAILMHLLDGRCHPAGDLAAAAGITPQTTSFHLTKMTEIGMVTVEKHGRHRYYRIAQASDAEAIEQLLSFAGPTPVVSLRQSDQMKKLRHARMCYDHLAGEVAVRITKSLLEREHLLKEGLQLHVTASGERFFEEIGLDLLQLRKKRRAFSRCCLDWTEREYHLAGALGQGLTERMLEMDWFRREERSRAVRITQIGKQGIAERFGIQLDCETAGSAVIQPEETRE